MTNSSALKFTGSPGITFAQPGVVQRGDGEWIEAKEVEPPSIRPVAFDPIEEGAMAVIQQALSEDVAMTIRDEALTRQRDGPRFDAAPERRFWV